MRLRRERAPRPDTDQPAFNRAAFSPDDLEDAERGRPDVSLCDYAEQRGLEFLDRSRPAGFAAATPAKDELRSNVMRGTLPGSGEHGILFHEGLEVGYSIDSPDWGGTFYGERVKLDVDGSLFFGEAAHAAVRVPCTVAAVRVPETAGVHPYIRIDTRRSSPPFSFTNRTKLDDLVGSKGWSVWCEPEPQRATVEQLIQEPIAQLIRAHASDGLFQAVVWWGTLVVRRNGYLADPAELDELAHAASAIAARLRETCLPLTDPQPFTTQLPRPLTSEARDLPAGFYPNDTWRGWALALRDRYSLALENPVAYHRAFPTVPAPGSAYVVLRGEIPGVGFGRLVACRENEACRAAVVVPAPAGAHPGPKGGLPMPQHGVRVEVHDGLAAVWSTTSYWGDAMLGDVDAFCASAGAALRELGAAA